MTAYEISMVSIFGFIAILLLVFVIIAIRALTSFRERIFCLLEDIEDKLHDLDPAFNLVYRVGATVDEKVEEKLREEEEVPGWLDLAVQVASLATMGMSLWEKHSKGRRRS